MPSTSACPEKDILRRFRQGKSPPPEAKRIAAHLEQCERCRRTFTDLVSADTLSEEDPPQPTTPNLPNQEQIASLKPQTQANSPSSSKTTPNTDSLPSSPSLPKEDSLAYLQDSLAAYDSLLGSPAPPPPPPLPEDSLENTAPLQTDKSDSLNDFLAPPQQPDEMGRLGEYRVLSILGTGGMGVVFKAEDIHLLRPVALKVMKPSLVTGETNRQRFLREARTAARVKSDYIVTIYGAGYQGNIPYLAMEYLRGESLHQWLKRGKRPSIMQVLRLGREIALGLMAAHEADLIHRDIKPGNIWLEAPKGRVKLLDFGLARPLNESGKLTQLGDVIGTPSYMAPEQAIGTQVDARCDLFSLGCVLHQLCTGEQTFKGKDLVEKLKAITQHKPPPPHEINPDVPLALSKLIMQLLSKDCDQRPRSARAVAEALLRIERDRATSSSPSWPVINIPEPDTDPRPTPTPGPMATPLPTPMPTPAPTPLPPEQELPKIIERISFPNSPNQGNQWWIIGMCVVAIAVLLFLLVLALFRVLQAPANEALVEPGPQLLVKAINPLCREGNFHDSHSSLSTQGPGQCVEAVSCPDRLLVHSFSAATSCEKRIANKTTG